jgi:hypothetical protein
MLLVPTALGVRPLPALHPSSWGGRPQGWAAARGQGVLRGRVAPGRPLPVTLFRAGRLRPWRGGGAHPATLHTSSPLHPFALHATRPPLARTRALRSRSDSVPHPFALRPAPAPRLFMGRRCLQCPPTNSGLHFSPTADQISTPNGCYPNGSGASAHRGPSSRSKRRRRSAASRLSAAATRCCDSHAAASCASALTSPPSLACSGAPPSTARAAGACPGRPHSCDCPSVAWALACRRRWKAACQASCSGSCATGLGGARWRLWWCGGGQAVWCTSPARACTGAQVRG